MQVVNLPERTSWNDLLQRPFSNNTDIAGKVKMIVADVKENGDTAIRKYTSEYDGVAIENLLVPAAEISNAQNIIPSELKSAIQQAANNITLFHEQSKFSYPVVETMPGVKCWKRSLPIEKVGLYIPGGSAPLFSTLLMLGIPAKLAGCSEIIVCTPAGKDSKVHPAILYTAALLGIENIYCIGGAQAIAAMAYGTETIPMVYKIFGPGNRYVTTAKQLVQIEGIAIDMPAGPSEVVVLADATANAKFVAADLLSQAEHGADSQVLLVTTSPEIVKAVQEEIAIQINSLARKDMIRESLLHSKIILLDTIEQAIEMVNEYAPEHLIVCCNNDEIIAAKIINAGSVFLGNYSPESVGDYASGTNHSLPTNGYARAYSGVNVESFMKTITYQKLDIPGLQKISNTVITMATAEGLDAHANAVKIRLNV